MPITQTLGIGFDFAEMLLDEELKEEEKVYLALML